MISGKIISITKVVVFLVVVAMMGIQRAATQATKHEVKSLPFLTGATPLPSSFVGYLPLLDNPTLDAEAKKESQAKYEQTSVKNRKNAKLFYWYLPYSPVEHDDEHQLANAPLLIYLNGGPGCTSLLSLFFDSGPFVLNGRREDGKFDFQMRSEEDRKRNSWNTLGHVLYLDAPVGTGFSHSVRASGSGHEFDGIPTTSKLAAVDLYTAISEFLKAFPQLDLSPIFFIGNGYSSKSILYLSRIVNLNPKAKPFNLAGIILGDALLKPSIQYASYARYGYARGIVSYEQMVNMNQLFEKCLRHVQTREADKTNTESCQPLFTNMIIDAGNVDPYDLRALASTDKEGIIVDYLTHNEVLKALNIIIPPNQPQTSLLYKCRNTVFEAFKYELHMDIPDQLLPTILDEYKIPVLIYNGQYDIRCNVLGTQEVLRSMKWNGREWFNNMKTSLFTKVQSQGETPSPENIHGQFRSYQGLTHVVIYKANHRGVDPSQYSNPDAYSTLQEMTKRFIDTASLPAADIDNALCDPLLDTRCAKKALICPNKCSLQGRCVVTNNGPLCRCNEGYSGSDCSIGNFAHSLNNKDQVSSTQFAATILGRDAVVYRLKFNPTVTLLDIYVTLTKISETGSPYLLANVSSSEQAPDGRFMKHIARSQVEYNVLNGMNGWLNNNDRTFDGISSSKFLEQGSFYPYFNVSHETSKQLHVDGVFLYRAQENVLAIAVYNDEDAPCTFNITVSTKPGTGEVHLYYLFLGLSMFLLLVIGLEIMIIVSRRNVRIQLEQKLTKSPDRARLLDHQ